MNELDNLLLKDFSNLKRYTLNGEEEITDFSDQDNLIIKGDNLPVLRCLKKRYKGKVKLIYIDPPYNTGGTDYSYKNRFEQSDWISFMKERLVEAKDFLTEDGFIVIAIDHSELFYLGVLSDEIFGKENFISIITVQHNPKGRNQSKFFSNNSEFLLVYAKSKKKANFYKVAISEDVIKTFTEKDSKGRFRWESYIRAKTSWSHSERPLNWYPIYVSKDLKRIDSKPIEDSFVLYPVTNSGEFAWKNIKETFDSLNKDGFFRVIEKDGKLVLEHKYREQEVLKNVWIDKKYQSGFNGTTLLKDLIGENEFTYPKSLYAVSDIVKIMSGEGDIVLDFFGGSGTTAHAVLFANKEQGIHRKFILCELLDHHIDIIKRRMNALKTKDLFEPFVYCELNKQKE